jgi:hypothetical protein
MKQLKHNLLILPNEKRSFFQEYISILAQRGNSNVALNRTACVADNMLGRMYTGAGRPDDWELDPGENRRRPTTPQLPVCRVIVAL